MFLPMLLPVLTLGFLTDWKTAATVGFLAPIMSALLTGMPPIMPPVAFMMMVELAVLGGLASVLYFRARWNLWLSMIVTVVVTRLVSFLLHVMVAELFNIPGVVYGLASFIFGLPGIVIQLLVVPIVVRSVERRYGKPR